MSLNYELLLNCMEFFDRVLPLLKSIWINYRKSLLTSFKTDWTDLTIRVSAYQTATVKTTELIPLLFKIFCPFQMNVLLWLSIRFDASKKSYSERPTFHLPDEASSPGWRLCRRCPGRAQSRRILSVRITVRLQRVWREIGKTFTAAPQAFVLALSRHTWWKRGGICR